MVRRDSGARSRKNGIDLHGRAHRVRPTRVEPSTFAWIEPLDELDPVIVEKIVEKEVIVEKPVVFEKIVERVVEKPAAAGKYGHLRVRRPRTGEPVGEHAGKTIIIGRGPSLTERLVRVAPDPKPVLAGACALIIALAGVALISPSGERATAARSTAPLGAAERSSGGMTANIGLPGSGGAAPSGAARDPFAAKNYKPRPAAAGKRTAGKNGRGGGSKAATPGSATPSLFAANFITYSSYTPWSKIKRRSGGWIDFGGKPTVKVVSVGANAVELFVVTDVEVLTDRSRSINYSNPLRLVEINPNGVVRFADYRDINGQDVEYTIRFRGSLPVNLTPAG